MNAPQEGNSQGKSTSNLLQRIVDFQEGQDFGEESILTFNKLSDSFQNFPLLKTNEKGFVDDKTNSSLYGLRQPKSFVEWCTVLIYVAFISYLDVNPQSLPSPKSSFGSIVTKIRDTVQHLQDPSEMILWGDFIQDYEDSLSSILAMFFGGFPAWVVWGKFGNRKSNSSKNGSLFLFFAVRRLMVFCIKDLSKRKSIIGEEFTLRHMFVDRHPRNEPSQAPSKQGADIIDDTLRIDAAWLERKRKQLMKKRGQNAVDPMEEEESLAGEENSVEGEDL